MKKFKISVIALLAAAMPMFTSCFNLEEEVYSEITQATFTPSDQDVAALLASAYADLAYFFDWQGGFDALEEPADVIITPVRPNGWDDGGTYQRMHKHTWSTDEWQPWNTYETAFTGINSTNRVLGQIEGGELPLDEALKASTIDELKAVRALWYSILLDTHGNVPIVTAFTDEVPEYKTRSDVYKFVTEEFEAIIKNGNLTEEKNASTYSRMNMWAVKMALMRVYLNAESYNIGKKAYEEALSLAGDIINNSPYELSADFSDNFKVDLDYTNTEVIFALPYDAVYDAGGHTFCQNAKWYPPVSKNYFGWSYQCWGGSCANPQFINTYDRENDPRFAKTWMYGSCANSEGIVWWNLNYLPSLTSKDDAGKTMTSIDFGLRQYKFEPDVNTEFYWGNDFPYFRLAEAYLTKAECLLRTGGSADEAAAYVNEVRQRDTDPAPAISAADLQGDTKMVYGIVPWGALTFDMYNECNTSHDWSKYVETLEASQTPIQSGQDASVVNLGGMYDEWGWEFALEGRRRADMIRFGTYSTKNWFNHAAITDGHTALFPIPDDVLNANQNLKQNPGY